MIRKISVQDLKPGMEVVRMSSDMWTHLPYLYTKPGVIESEMQIHRIRQEGYLDVFVRYEIPGSTESEEERLERLILDRTSKAPAKNNAPFHEEFRNARKAYDEALHLTRRMVSDVKMGRQVDVEATGHAVEGIIETAARNPDALICLSKLSRYDSYTYAHSINVAAIAVVFGEYLELPKDELLMLGMAGMLHDLGKTAVPDRIINKKGRLTPREFEEVKKHPTYGRKILEKSGNIPQRIIQAVEEHHEKFNGSGYPSGLRKDDTGVFGRLLSLADVYDALTSDRSYKNAILPNKALAIMYGMRDQDFCSSEVQMFIKCLGIFPSGSLVRLDSGNLGVVLESNPQRPLLPKIKVILDEDLRPIPAQLVDLAATETPTVSIVECADPSQYRINLKPYLQSPR
ncbi:HD-GYP domain-containing protein [Salidesulfovibrio brasiliensis]|uniref:HD-GYP domain-containing protein n=1 Tax=Salidesulfovibrio brasiliensis TaxID=221711 RepID=UPI0006CF4E44|nr:HD-GYP domain-containing protein [Salidesulfovibrio brasiliensis]